MFLTSLMRIYLTRSLKPFHFKGEYRNALDFESLGDLGLYVHIPFCRSICSFCPYCKEVYHKETADKYKTALLTEIDLSGQNLKSRKKVTSLFFGGGSPALMIDDLMDIIDRLKQYFLITEGIGAELHPDDVTYENLVKLKQAGVSMVSLGLQSFNEECLRKLGRRSNSFTEKLQLIRSMNFDVVDVDLIFAIPGQTEKILMEDITRAFENGATQISTYPFIDFTFTDNQYKPMSERVKKRMLKNIADHCESLGKERTSIWTFADRETGKYSSVTRDAFLGFGVSATTLLKDTFKINTFSVKQYIARIKECNLPTSLTLNFTQRQRAVYYLFWSAYAMKIFPDKFQAFFGKPLQKMFGLEFWLLEKLGLVVRNKDHYELTLKGACCYHYIEQAYTTSYIDKMWNISRKVPFPEEIVLK